MLNMKISEKGLKFLVSLEGCRDTIYKDSVGLDTIGVGHLVKKGEVFEQPMKLEAIYDLLRKDLAPVEEAINRLISVPLTQNQFDALCCLVFNIGIGDSTAIGVGGFTNSTVRKVINRNGSFNEIRGAWLLWKKAGGMVSKGLLSRRFKEIALYGS